jgi:hypothetical protein
MVLAILSQSKTFKQLKTQKPYIYKGDHPFYGELSEMQALKSLYEMEVSLKKGRVVLNKGASLD